MLLRPSPPTPSQSAADLVMMGISTASTAVPTEVERPETHQVPAPELPWLVIVWNDPINLMSYVTYVFQKLFGYSREKAHKLMLDVHYKGRAVVSSGPKETGRARHRPATPTWALGNDGAQRVSWRHRIRAVRGGGYEVRLAVEERALLSALPLQLVSLLDDVGDEPTGGLPEVLRRLLPPAYATDPDAERAFVSMTRQDLVEHHPRVARDHVAHGEGDPARRRAARCNGSPP